MKDFITYEAFYSCQCSCSVMKATQYNTAGTPEDIVEISIYPMNPKYRGILTQLKWIWHILTKQCVWDDQIMLGKEDCERLGNSLLRLAKEMK